MSASEREPDVEQLVAEREQRPIGSRHPAQVTEDRIADHIIKFAAHLTPAEVLACDLTIMALAQVPAREAAARRAGVDRG